MLLTNRIRLRLGRGVDRLETRCWWVHLAEVVLRSAKTVVAESRQPSRGRRSAWDGLDFLGPRFRGGNSLIAQCATPPLPALSRTHVAPKEPALGSAEKIVAARHVLVRVKALRAAVLALTAVGGTAIAGAVS
jgi:hypothetical protein